MVFRLTEVFFFDCFLDKNIILGIVVGIVRDSVVIVV